MMQQYNENKRFKAELDQENDTSNLNVSVSTNENDSSEPSASSPSSILINSSNSLLSSTNVSPALAFAAFGPLGNITNKNYPSSYVNSSSYNPSQYPSGYSNSNNYISQNYPSSSENYSNFNFQNHFNLFNNPQTNSSSSSYSNNPHQQYSQGVYKNSNVFNPYSCLPQQQAQMRKSIGSSSSSADSSASSLNLNSPTGINNENTIQSSTPRIFAQTNSSSSSSSFQAPIKPSRSSLNTTSNSENEMPNNQTNKKRRAVPPENKDNTYWEKRRKNNESAKRSRDNKRSREEEINHKCFLLQEENIRLRTELALLRSEHEKLKTMFYANTAVTAAVAVSTSNALNCQ